MHKLTATPVLVQVVDRGWGEVHNVRTGELVSARPIVEDIVESEGTDWVGRLMASLPPVTATPADQDRARQILADKVELRTAQRLEELRTEIRAERISYGELAELQSLADQIEPGDTELLEWAGVPEHGAPLEDDEADIWGFDVDPDSELDRAEDAHYDARMGR
jgi:hypothetical protein